MTGMMRDTEDGFAGVHVSVAALVIALDRAGVLSKRNYADELRRLWVDMSEDAAEGEAGALIESVLALVGEEVCPQPAPVAIRQERAPDCAPPEPLGERAAPQFELDEFEVRLSIV